MKNILKILPICLAHTTFCEDINYTNWMKNIPNHKSIFALTIPGTHDSAASQKYHVRFRFRIFYDLWQTQVYSIT